MVVINYDKKNEDLIMAFATYFPILCLMLQTFLYSLFGEQQILHYCILLLSAIPVLFAATIWVKRNMIGIGLCYLIVIVVCLLNFIFFPENRVSYWSNLLLLLIMCLPCFLNSCLIRDDEEEAKIIIKISYVIFVLGEIVLLVSLTGNGFENRYSMAYSYYMLLPALIFVYYGQKKRNVLFFLLTLIDIVSMVMIGSRGAVIALVVYCALTVLFSSVKKITKAFVVIVVGIIIAYSHVIIDYVYQVFKQFGINSRTLELLRLGELLSHDSGRSQIQKESIHAILEQPITGNGILSENRLLGTYSHNLFLDILLQGGLIFGGLIIAVIVVLMIRSFFAARDKNYYLLFFCYGFLPMMVSDSYLTNMPFWIYMGYCIRKQNIRIKVSNGYILQYNINHIVK